MPNSFLRLRLCMSALLLPAAAIAGSDNTVDVNQNDAQWQCEGFVQKSLANPKKAAFDYFGSFPTKKLKDGSYSVQVSFAEAEGGQKQKMECIAKLIASGEWQQVSLKPLP